MAGRRRSYSTNAIIWKESSSEALEWRHRALQIGEASKVVPIDKLSVVITLFLAFVMLHEEISVKAVVGCVLIGAGTLVMLL